jgi:rare lipoprotein A
MRFLFMAAVAASSLLLSGCAGTRPTVDAGGGSGGSDRTSTWVGFASYYGAEFQGRRTASGQRFDQDELTAAHRTLPFGTRVRVTNLKNSRSVVVTINDRGPFRRGRILDVSRRAASELGFLRAGVARVKLRVLEDG